MYLCIIVVVVCFAAQRLYDRGEGKEALFLLAFALSQLLIDDGRTRLSTRVFLPMLSLGILVVQYGGRKDGSKKGKVIAKKILTITLHFLVIMNTVHNTDDDSMKVHESVELSVYCFLLFLVFTLPASSGVCVLSLCIIAIAGTSLYCSGLINWDFFGNLFGVRDWYHSFYHECILPRSATVIEAFQDNFHSETLYADIMTFLFSVFLRGLKLIERGLMFFLHIPLALEAQSNVLSNSNSNEQGESLVQGIQEVQDVQGVRGGGIQGQEQGTWMEAGLEEPAGFGYGFGYGLEPVLGVVSEQLMHLVAPPGAGMGIGIGIGGISTTSSLSSHRAHGQGGDSIDSIDTNTFSGAGVGYGGDGTDGTAGTAGAVWNRDRDTLSLVGNRHQELWYCAIYLLEPYILFFAISVLQRLGFVKRRRRHHNHRNHRNHHNQSYQSNQSNQSDTNASRSSVRSARSDPVRDRDRDRYRDRDRDRSGSGSHSNSEIESISEGRFHRSSSSNSSGHGSSTATASASFTSRKLSSNSRNVTDVKDGDVKEVGKRVEEVKDEGG